MNSPSKNMLLGWGLLALAPVMVTPAMAQGSADAFFRGKTINYIVATAAGGAYDGYGRLTARHMEKYLPGTTIVILNRPGAGHLIGTNLLYASKPDGLTIGTFNMGVIYSQLVGVKAAQYDLGKIPGSAKRRPTSA